MCLPPPPSPVCLSNNIVSWEPEGRYCSSKIFRWEPEGRYCCTKSMAIAPFWFSVDDIKREAMPNINTSHKSARWCCSAPILETYIIPMDDSSKLMTFAIKRLSVILHIRIVELVQKDLKCCTVWSYETIEWRELICVINNNVSLSDFMRSNSITIYICRIIKASILIHQYFTVD